MTISNELLTARVTKIQPTLRPIEPDTRVGHLLLETFSLPQSPDQLISYFRPS